MILLLLLLLLLILLLLHLLLPLLLFLLLCRAVCGVTTTRRGTVASCPWSSTWRLWQRKAATAFFHVVLLLFSIITRRLSSMIICSLCLLVKKSKGKTSFFSFFSPSVSRQVFSPQKKPVFMQKLAFFFCFFFLPYWGSPPLVFRKLVFPLVSWFPSFWKN